MGLGQSYLYIYLDYRERRYGDCRDQKTGYDVHASKAVESGCKNFEVVTYKIKYRGDGRYFDVYIYENKESIIKSSYIFAYCWPSIKSHVVNEVRVYYSILAPDIPLIISFVRGQNDIHNCDIDQLRSAGWDWASSITKYSLGSDLATHLKNQFKKLFWNKTIEFDVGNKQTSNVIVFPRVIDKKTYRIVFIPHTNAPVLNNSCLFTFDTKLEPDSQKLVVQGGCKPSDSAVKNQIDTYFLHSVNTVKFFHGIIVYFIRDKEQEDVKPDEQHHKNRALFVEFINDCESKYLKRKDKNGYWWAEETITYNDDKSLGIELGKIETESISKDVNTVILEKKSNYIGVSKCEKGDNKAYNKYTHEFESSKKTALLFKRTDPGIGSLKQLDNTAQKVEVYYLEAGGKEDEQPFLIVFDEDGSTAKKKCYHFNNNDKFKEWKTFQFSDKSGTKLDGEALVNKLYDKLKLIEEYGGCSEELHLLKPLAHKILLAKDGEEIKKPGPPEEPVRPPVGSPPPEPEEGLPIVWIIAGSVGGAVLLIASTVGYAIHWYNTTIRLLT